ILVALLAILWSSSELFRRLLKINDTINTNINWPLFFLIGGLSVLVFLLVARRSEYYSKLVFGLLILLIGSNYYRWINRNDSIYVSGAGQVASTLRVKGTSSITLLFKEIPHQSFFPQLTYYTNGWTLGWIGGKTSQSFSFDKADSLFSI